MHLNWIAFPVLGSCIIEWIYQAQGPRAVVKLKHNSFGNSTKGYLFSFEQMAQINLENGSARNICRIEVKNSNIESVSKEQVLIEEKKARMNILLQAYEDSVYHTFEQLESNLSRDVPLETLSKDQLVDIIKNVSNSSRGLKQSLLNDLSKYQFESLDLLQKLSLELVKSNDT